MRLLAILIFFIACLFGSGVQEIVKEQSPNKYTVICDDNLTFSSVEYDSNAGVYSTQNGTFNSLQEAAQAICNN